MKKKIVFIPLGNQVSLIPVIMEEEKTAGGLYLPEQSKGKAIENEGIVDKIGADVTKVKVGDKVLYTTFMGKLVGTMTDIRVLVSEPNLLAVIEEVDEPEV